MFEKDTFVVDASTFATRKRTHVLPERGYETMKLRLGKR